jgi:hypothetical protein
MGNSGARPITNTLVWVIAEPGQWDLNRSELDFDRSIKALVAPYIQCYKEVKNEKKNVFIKIVTPLAKLCRIVWSGTFITNTLVWVIAEPGQWDLNRSELDFDRSIKAPPYI